MGLLAAIGLCTATGIGAQAATITVCPNGCDYSTVDGAVKHASSGDTITIAAGTYQGGVSIDKNLTLKGAGAANTTISGGAPVIWISNASVTVSDLTITGGWDTNGDGAGIVNDFGTLTLDHSTVTHNGAPRGHGGGIFNTGTLTLDHSTVSHNTADEGGGISNGPGTATLQNNSTVSDNTAQSDGGGIFNAAMMTVTHTDFTGNTARNKGGGIFIAPRSYLKMTICYVVVNKADHDGGGVFVAGDSDFSSNLVAENTPNNISGPGARSHPAFAPVDGSPFTTSAGPISLAFSPNGKLLAVAGVDPGTVTMFSVGHDGTLTPINSSVKTGTVTRSLAFSPDGNLLATAGFGNGTVSVFAVGQDGSLKPVAGSPFRLSDRLDEFEPMAVAFNSDGRLLASANIVEPDGHGTVSMFSVGSGGGLTQVSGSPFLTGRVPNSVAFNPDGQLLANANGGINADSVSVFGVGAEGKLHPLPESPFTVRSPDSAVFSPNGRWLVTSSGENALTVFSVGSSGRLTPVSGSPFTTGKDPYGVAFSPDGSRVANANSNDDTVSVFSVGQDGALAPITGSPFATGSAPGSVAFSPNGRLLATANYKADSVSVYAVNK